MGGARSGLTHSQLHSHTIHQVREGPAGQVAQSSDLVTVMTCARKMVLVGYCCVQALAGQGGHEEGEHRGYDETVGSTLWMLCAEGARSVACAFFLMT